MSIVWRSGAGLPSAERQLRLCFCFWGVLGGLEGALALLASLQAQATVYRLRDVLGEREGEGEIMWCNVRAPTTTPTPLPDQHIINI